MKYSVNWIQTKNGNAAEEGSILKIKIGGAYFFSGAIYQNGFPVIPFQTLPGDDNIEVLIKRKGISLKGQATLKVRAFDKNWRGSGWNDDFDII